MTKQRKIIFASLASAAALAAIPLAVVACSSNKDSIAAKKRFTSEFNAPISTPPYNFDFSASFGTTVNTNTTRISVDLFRIETKGSPEFKPETGAVIKPTLARYKMVYGSKIIITYADGSTKEFTNDNVDPVTDAVLAANTNPVLFQTSSDSSSINSADFISALNPTSGSKAVKFQISVKDNLFWSDIQGNKTKYQIVAEDFYYSYIRTNLLTKSYRFANGGLDSVDEDLITAGVSTRYTDDDAYRNGYLFGIFGVSQANLLDRSKTLTGNNGEFFTLNALDVDQGADFYSAFTKILNNSLLFSGAPSQFIKENAVKTTSGITTDTAANINNVTGQAKDSQIYEYGFDTLPSGPKADGTYKSTTTFFGGHYIPTTIDAPAGRIIYTQNKNHPDFLDVNGNFVEKNQISSLVDRYNPSTNNDIFTSQQLTGFKQGDLDVISYSALNSTQQDEIKNLVRRTRSLSNNSLLQRTALVSAPAPEGVDKNGKIKYNFNDAYSLLNYGNDLKTLSTGNANVSQTFFAGTGLRFRSILQSAINWFTYADTISGGQFDPWVSAFAPDGVIGGSDQTSSNFKTLRTGTTSVESITISNGVATITNVQGNVGVLANELILLNKNLTEIEKTNAAKDLVVFGSNQDSLTNQFKSAVYQEAKAQMKLLLDEFYAANTTLDSSKTSDKITWDIAYPYSGSPSPSTESAFQNVKNTINSLDERLNVDFYIPNTADNFFDRITGNFSTSNFSGWGYDYDGIGSGFDGQTHNDGVGMVPAFGIFAKLSATDSLAITFPEFYKLSKAIEASITAGVFKTEIPLTNWDSLTNQELNNTIETLSVAGGNISEEFAKFFIRYQASHTNQELIDLTREFSTLKGNSLEIGRQGQLSTATQGSFTSLLLNSRFTAPVVVVGSLFESDIDVTL